MRKRRRPGPRLGEMIERRSPKVKSPRAKSPRYSLRGDVRWAKSPNPGYTYEGDPISRDRYAPRPKRRVPSDPGMREIYERGRSPRRIPSDPGMRAIFLRHERERKRPRRRRPVRTVPDLRGRPKGRIVY